MKFETKTIHAGVHPDPFTGAIMTPIYQTSTYVQRSPGDHDGYEYSRTHNPTRTQLQNNLASLENGNWGLCFGSGMGAIDTLCKVLNPGDEVIATNDLYGGSYRIFTKVYQDFGIKFHFVDLSEIENFKEKINSKTRMVWIETPTNPMLTIIDIRSIAGIAKANGILTVVDNTFCSPYLQNPLDLGADIVMHSVTKYINGHSDVVMGAIIGKDEAMLERLSFIQNSCGAVPGPFDCFLTLRGIKTLHVRMARHCENGKVIANYLRNHPKVNKVYWPGFEDHKNHLVAKSQMKDFGGMISFTLKEDSIEAAHRFLSRSKLFALAESLGGVESLCGHPSSMTHASIPREERLKSGLVDSLIRLSVGIENADDLMEDLDQALS
ncbi:MAG: cystathionine gamma-synthase [Flavobacteriales bacterium]|nr:cystathionine gamma-synthase [Flavobacteriales bacterium]